MKTSRSTPNINHKMTRKKTRTYYMYVGNNLLKFNRTLKINKLLNIDLISNKLFCGPNSGGEIRIRPCAQYL